MLSHFSHVRLCDPMDCSLPDSFVHGILGKVKVKGIQLCPTLLSPWNFLGQILEWVAFPFSGGFFQPRPPTLQTDFLPTELSGNPSEEGSLPLAPPERPKLVYSLIQFLSKYHTF